IGRDFEVPAVRIRLVQQMAAARANLVLVAGVSAQLGDENLPHPRRYELAHRADAPVPSIEIADDADALRVRCPDREVHAGQPFDGDAPAAEFLPRAVMRPFGEQM